MTMTIYAYQCIKTILINDTHRSQDLHVSIPQAATMGGIRHHNNPTSRNHCPIKVVQFLLVKSHARLGRAIEAGYKRILFTNPIAFDAFTQDFVGVST